AKDLKALTFVATVYERLPGNGGRKPLAGVNVTVRKVGESLTGAPKGTSGADGKVSLQVAAAGKYQAVAQLKGYKSVGPTVDITTGGNNNLARERVKDAATTTVALNLRVVEGKDKNAPPVAGAQVTVSQQGRTVKTGTSDPKGGLS